MNLIARLSAAVGVLTLIYLLLAALALRVGASLPTSEMAFVVAKFGTFDIRLLDANRLSMVALTRSEYSKDPPVWSPDGTQLAFNARGSSSGLYLIDADGRHLRQVADNVVGQNSVWSPDGKRLAFIGLNGGGFYLNVFDLASSHIFAVTAQDGPIGTPTWSPDGSRLVFGISTGLFHGLYVVRLDGGSPAFLTSDAARSPVWSPDGREIVYSSSDQNGGLFAIPGSCAMQGQSCGGAARKLADLSFYSGAASWSPDGQALAYFAPGDCPSPYGSLYVLSNSSDQPSRLFDCRMTGNLMIESQPPVWSLDGREIALTAPDGVFNNIYIVTVADGAVRPLTLLPDFNMTAQYPAWKP